MRRSTNSGPAMRARGAPRQRARTSARRVAELPRRCSCASSRRALRRSTSAARSPRHSCHASRASRRDRSASPRSPRQRSSASLQDGHGCPRTRQAAAIDGHARMPARPAQRRPASPSRSARPTRCARQPSSAVRHRRRVVCASPSASSSSQRWRAIDVPCRSSAWSAQLVLARRLFVRQQRHRAVAGASRVRRSPSATSPPGAAW